MNCSCRKYGLRSSDICANCRGQSCSNIEQILGETDSLEDEIWKGEYDDVNGDIKDKLG